MLPVELWQYNCLQHRLIHLWDFQVPTSEVATSESEVATAKKKERQIRSGELRGCDVRVGGRHRQKKQRQIRGGEPKLRGGDIRVGGCRSKKKRKTDQRWRASSSKSEVATDKERKKEREIEVASSEFPGGIIRVGGRHRKKKKDTSEVASSKL
jgi:hypothetical protein